MTISKGSDQNKGMKKVFTCAAQNGLVDCMFGIDKKVTAAEVRNAQILFDVQRN